MSSGTDISIIAVAVAVLIFFSGADEEMSAPPATPARPAPPAVPEESAAETDWVRHIAESILRDDGIPTNDSARAPGEIRGSTRLLQATASSVFEQGSGDLNEVDGRRRA